MHICLLAQTLGYIEGGGHFWVYLNWALGLQRAGAQIIWMETLKPEYSPDVFGANRRLLEERLQTYGLKADLAFIRENGENLSGEFGSLSSLTEVAARSDLLINLCYSLPESVVRQFRRKVLIDIDPGLLQTWVKREYFKLASYDRYFTISATIGKAGNPIPTLGLPWQHTPPCVDTLSWPVTASPADAPLTTVSHWEADEYVVEDDGSFYENTKKAAFTPYLGLAKLVTLPVELALCIKPEQAEQFHLLRELGWGVRSSLTLTATPAKYQAYIQSSRGEFSISKPSYVKMQSGWISDRTLCYLASGKPAILQNTGPLDYVPKDCGLLRFSSVTEAVTQFNYLSENYYFQAQAARHLAETIFDARIVATRLLEQSLL